MTKSFTRNLKENWKLHVPILLAGVIFDQISKIWAVAHFSLENGDINHLKTVNVFGEAARFKLVYNEGAAFGLQPQKIIPGIDPTLFYGVISILAIVGLYFFYNSLRDDEKSSQLGIILIISGAFGNFIDRIRIQKVVDFIDVEFPNISIDAFSFLGMQFNGFIMHRWPTFNIADALVCVGVCLIIFMPMIMRKKSKTTDKSKQVSQPQTQEN